MLLTTRLNVNFSPPALPMLGSARKDLLRLQHGSGNDDLHNLVGALQDLVHPDIPQELFNWIILEISVATM